MRHVEQVPADHVVARPVPAAVKVLDGNQFGAVPGDFQDTDEVGPAHAGIGEVSLRAQADLGCGVALLASARRRGSAEYQLVGAGLGADYEDFHGVLRNYEDVPVRVLHQVPRATAIGEDDLVVRHQSGAWLVGPDTEGVVGINRWCGGKPPGYAAVGIQLVEEDLPVAPAGGSNKAAVRVNGNMAGRLAGKLRFPVGLQSGFALPAVRLDLPALFGRRVHHRQGWVYSNERRRLYFDGRSQPFQAAVQVRADGADTVRAAAAVGRVRADPLDIGGWTVVGCAVGHGPILPRFNPLFPYPGRPISMGFPAVEERRRAWLGLN